MVNGVDYGYYGFTTLYKPYSIPRFFPIRVVTIVGQIDCPSSGNMKPSEVVKPQTQTRVREQLMYHLFLFPPKGKNKTQQNNFPDQAPTVTTCYKYVLHWMWWLSYQPWLLESLIGDEWFRDVPCIRIRVETHGVLVAFPFFPLAPGYSRSLQWTSLRFLKDQKVHRWICHDFPLLGWSNF